MSIVEGFGGWSCSCLGLILLLVGEVMIIGGGWVVGGGIGWLVKVELGEIVVFYEVMSYSFFVGVNV